MAEKKTKKTDNVDKKIKTLETAEPVKVKEIDPHQYVVVRNGFQGTLVYISKRTTEKFVWPQFGDELEMELIELKNAKSSNKDFFINNWFMFYPEDDWVIDYLGVRQYYKNAIPLDGFDDIFKLPADQLKKKLTNLSEGQKNSLKYRAIQLINAGEIDSNKTIKTLEEVLHTQLVEH